PDLEREPPRARSPNHRRSSIRRPARSAHRHGNVLQVPLNASDMTAHVPVRPECERNDGARWEGPMKRLSSVGGLVMLAIIGGTALARDVCLRDSFDQTYMFSKVARLRPGMAIPLTGMRSRPGRAIGGDEL